MKLLKLLLIGLFFIASNSTHAQVSVNVNIGSPPTWGPVGYSEVEYYYLPDIESYYDVRTSQFIYFGGGKWVYSRNLPSPYRNYNLYNGYKVVLKDYHGTTPFTYFKNHKAKYYKGYKGKPQKNRGSEYGNHDNYNDSHDNNDHDNKDYRDNDNDKHENKGNNGKGNGKNKH